MNLIGKLICKLPRVLGGGHRRGKLDHLASVTDTYHVNVYRCERCGAIWTRKVKKEKAE